MTNATCNVAIVGCGLGGVAAAIGIRRAGHVVTIYERAQALAELGAGIQLPYNCTRVLKQWNVLSAVESISVRPAHVVLRSYGDGKTLFKRALPCEKPDDTPHLLTNRADLLKVLYEEAVRLGVRFHFGSTVSKIDFIKPAIEFSDGANVACNVIFGADGQKSFCRELFLGHSDPPQFSGDLAYRITIPVSEVETHPDLASLLESHDISCWMGPGAHVVCYQLKNALNVVLVAPDNPSPSLSDNNSPHANLQELEDVFHNWDPRLRKLFKLTKGVLKHRLLSSHEMPTWSHPNGTFALVGDACHVSTPHLAQGAAQALEDGATLGALFARLPQAPPTPALKAVLTTYESLRKPRTTLVIARSAKRRDLYQLPDGEEQEARDEGLLREGWGERYPEVVDEAEFQDWLAEWDAGVEVGRVVEGGLNVLSQS